MSTTATANIEALRKNLLSLVERHGALTDLLESGDLRWFEAEDIEHEARDLSDEIFDAEWDLQNAIASQEA